ncbi:right-handed parallel beta-helix repeat-containing protein [Staphylococcus sp. IVB6227]|uniref:right-handed parallel beta-helix repeat-containing protein n=1 Tax=Staphylococcus sp. IVB6227 TaxID=2989768 RepID=UPI0021D04107|nr:right-handed parallel beta-helix repeat-containing protein [Staphylococcus sp. IVB6227]UXR79060.1 right-handed parallel beta-helix repeat-containing protein [Staphylococcus sp. IVB6227]
MAKLSLFTKLSEMFNSYSISQHEKNYKEIERWANSTNEDMNFHRKEERYAHKSNQIEYRGNDLYRELKALIGYVDNLSLANNGDGIAEVTEAQVDIEGNTHAVLKERLRADFLNLEGKINQNAKEIEKGKVIKSAFDFDVYPDGAEDSAKGLQELFDWNSIRGGGMVIIPPGNYLINKRLIIPGNTTLFGYGAKIIRGNTDGWLTNIKNENQARGYSGESDIQISGLTFDGDYNNSNGMNGVVFANCQNINFKHCTFKDVTGAHALDFSGVKNAVVDQCIFEGQNNAVNENKEAIQISIASKDGIGEDLVTSYDSTPSKNIVVQNCYFGPSENFGGWATAVGDHFSVFDKWVSNVRIVNNFIEKTTNYALRVYKFKNVVIEGNTIEDCDGGIFATPTPGGYLSSHNAEGIQMGKAQGGNWIKITNNIIKKMNKNGIHVSSYPNKIIENVNESFDDVLISGNTFEDIKVTGIYVPEANKVKIINNNVEKSNVGIQSYGTSQLNVSGNVVGNSETIGIFISKNKNLANGSVQTFATISNNHVFSTGQDGIRVSQNAKYIHVTNNMISNYGVNATRDWEIGGIYFVDVHDSTINNNSIFNAKYDYVDAVRVSEDSTNIQVFNIIKDEASITILNPSSNFYGFRNSTGVRKEFE